MAKVVFDPAEFRALYPTLAHFTDTQLNFYFAKAELKVDNSESSCIPGHIRKILLYLLVAHFAELQARVEEGNSGLVGRISSATEGSVGASVAYDVKGDQAQWYSQTPYGAEFWAMSAPYRSMVYVVTHASMPVNRSRFGNWS